MKRLLLGGLAVAVVVGAPPLREALAALEPALAPGLFALALVMSLAERARKRRSPGSGPVGRRLGSQQALRVLGRWGWVAATLLCLAPLLAHWSFSPPSRIAAFASMFGQLPWADAQGHYEGAMRLLGDGVFGSFSERRPINACWLALNLTLTGGRLELALGLQAVAVGLALWLASRGVALRYGLWSSVAFFAITLALVRDYLPTVSTEPTGVALASLALGLFLLRGTAADPKLFGVALLAISVALAARPGPQLLLPALLLYGLLLFRKTRPRGAVALILVALVGGAHAAALNAFYGAGEGSLSAYPAYTLYGLSRASDYTAVQDELLAELPASATEEQIAEVAYARAFANLRSEPGTFARGLWGNFRKALGKVPVNVSRALSPRWLFVPREQRVLPSREETRADRRAALPLLVIAVVGWLASLRRAAPAERAFWATFGVGLLASVPFVFGDAGFRGLAVAYPAIALLFATGLATRRLPATSATRECERRLALASGTVLSLLLAATLTVPALIRGERTRPRGKPGASTVRGRVAHAPAVIVANRRVNVAAVPVIRRHEMQTWIDWSSDDRIGALGALPLPFALFAVYDVESGRVRNLVGDHRALRAEGFIELHVEPLDPDGKLERVLSWRHAAE